MPLSRYILGARGQTGNKPASSHAGLQPFVSADLQRPSFFAVASSPQQPVRPPLSVYRKTLSLYAWVRGKSRFDLPGGQGLPIGHAASLEPGARRRTSVDARVGHIDRRAQSRVRCFGVSDRRAQDRGCRAGIIFGGSPQRIVGVGAEGTRWPLLRPRFFRCPVCERQTTFS